MIYINTKSKSLLCFLLLLPIYVHANNGLTPAKSTEKIFILDPYGSPYATSSWLISGRDFMSEVEDKWITEKDKDKFWLRWSSLFINNVYNDLSMLFAHEVSGHGFRQRSFNQRVDGYGLSLLFGGMTSFISPINGLGGITHYNSYHLSDFGEKKFSYSDIELIKTIAGNEANAILANELILKNFKSGYLDYRNYNLFLKAFTNLLGYIIITHPHTRDRGNDILAYLKELEDKSHLNNIHLNTLQLNATIFFLNPILYVSIWSFYAYLFKKEQTFVIPHLSWDNMTYMPLIRIGLTPFGIGYYLDNFISNQEQTFLVSLNTGKSPFYTRFFGGIGCKTDELYTYKKYSLDIQANVWYQPKLLLKEGDTLEDKNYWGGLLGIHNRFKINPYFSIHGAVLYKTLGFIEGVVAQDGFMWQAGFSLNYV